MDEKITKILDELDITQAERLIHEDMKIGIDTKSLKRVKASVYRKIGMKRQWHMPRIITVVACVAIIISSTHTVGFDTIVFAISKMFSFIPEYGIIENNDSIQYVLAEKIVAKDGDTVLTLSNAVAGEEDISIMFTLEKENGYKELSHMQICSEIFLDCDLLIFLSSCLSSLVNSIKYLVFIASISPLVLIGE